jgi:hypothetical protein
VFEFHWVKRRLMACAPLVRGHPDWSLELELVLVPPELEHLRRLGKDVAFVQARRMVKPKGHLGLARVLSLPSSLQHPQPANPAPQNIVHNAP